MRGLLGAFLVEMALVSYRDITQGGIKVRQGQQSTAPIKAPLPSLYTSGIIVYGSLALIGSSFRAAAPVTTLVGWGFVVATLLNLYTPGSANAANAANAQAVQGITGATPPPTTTKPTA